MSDIGETTRRLLTLFLEDVSGLDLRGADQLVADLELPAPWRSDLSHWRFKNSAGWLYILNVSLSQH